ncbi:unnamed protein product [Staurois parvus]|uniref:Uncharacterized protein n=1 Tax=Staurois parvus TaxID=386267 RepID=A0ABN9CTN6_9NEOB|nr:unnamed protein product [Staurois parvus]
MHAILLQCTPYCVNAKQSTQFSFLLLYLAEVNLHGDFLQPFSSEDASLEVFLSVDGLDVSVRWLQFNLCYIFVSLLLQYPD